LLTVTVLSAMAVFPLIALVRSYGLTWTTVNVLFEPPYQGHGPFQPFASEWPGQAAIIEKALQDRKAGRLREPVVLAEIRCRPRSPVQRIEDLTITP